MVLLTTKVVPTGEINHRAGTVRSADFLGGANR